MLQALQPAASLIASFHAKSLPADEIDYCSLWIDMARPRRIFIADISVHVIQRGNNRMDIFREHRDYRSFLAFLQWAAVRYRVVIHAFVLMTNHFHLIVTPADTDGLPRMMKEIGSRHVSYYNRKYDRIGTLWNGRYRGLLIEDERYWLTCLRYVEQNPVRAGMVSAPDRYEWSSYSAHAFGDWPMWLTPHAVTSRSDKPWRNVSLLIGICAAPHSMTIN